MAAIQTSHYGLQSNNNSLHHPPPPLYQPNIPSQPYNYIFNQNTTRNNMQQPTYNTNYVSSYLILLEQSLQSVTKAVSDMNTKMTHMQQSLEFITKHVGNVNTAQTNNIQQQSMQPLQYNKTTPPTATLHQNTTQQKFEPARHNNMQPARHNNMQPARHNNMQHSRKPITLQQYLPPRFQTKTENQGTNQNPWQTVRNKKRHTSHPKMVPPQQFASTNRYSALQNEPDTNIQSEEPSFKFVEMKQGIDLFSAPSNFSLAHCVDKKMTMRKGIAKEFAQKFQRRDELQAMDKNVGQVSTLKDKKRHIFYLITKARHDSIPEVEHIVECLHELKQKCVLLGVKHLAIPRLACGLDRQKWSAIREYILDIFSNTNIELRVYFKPSDTAHRETKNKNNPKSATSSPPSAKQYLHRETPASNSDTPIQQTSKAPVPTSASEPTQQQEDNMKENNNNGLLLLCDAVSQSEGNNSSNFPRTPPTIKKV
jgi:hypothetical protein